MMVWYLIRSILMHSAELLWANCIITKGSFTFRQGIGEFFRPSMVGNGWKPSVWVALRLTQTTFRESWQAVAMARSRLLPGGFLWIGVMTFSTANGL